MSLRDWQLRARALFAPRRVERELDDELSFHIERETRKLIAEGMTGAEARARAMARFGSVTVAADECRDARGTALLDSVVRDVRYACRSFRRAPLVALTIVTTMALGLGLVTVVYQFVSPEYFSVLGIDLARGRGFTPTERSASAAVAVVSESVARQLWPGPGPCLCLDRSPSAARPVHGARARDAPGR